MKFAICNEIFGKASIEQACAGAAQAGYDGIEIAPFTIAPYVMDISPRQRRDIVLAAEKNQLAISAIHWVLAHTEGLHLTQPDPTVRHRTSQYLSALVDFCADLGGKFMVVGSPKQRSLSEAVSKEQGWEW